MTWAKVEAWLRTPRSGPCAGCSWGGCSSTPAPRKLAHPAEMARFINGYRLLHPEVVNFAAIVLPWVEVGGRRAAGAGLAPAERGAGAGRIAGIVHGRGLSRAGAGAEHFLRLLLSVHGRGAPELDAVPAGRPAAPAGPTGAVLAQHFLRAPAPRRTECRHSAKRRNKTQVTLRNGRQGRGPMATRRLLGGNTCPVTPGVCNPI